MQCMKASIENRHEQSEMCCREEGIKIKVEIREEKREDNLKPRTFYNERQNLDFDSLPAHSLASSAHILTTLTTISLFPSSAHCSAQSYYHSARDFFSSDNCSPPHSSQSTSTCFFFFFFFWYFGTWIFLFLVISLDLFW